MKITNLTLYKVPPRWLFLKIDTDEGLTGWGEPEVMSAISGIDQALREIARYTSTPIATGERMFSRWEFKNLLKDGYVDIIQPDLSHRRYG